MATRRRLTGRGKQHKEVGQFLRWGSAPNPAQVPRVMVLVLGLGLVGLGLVGFGWLVLMVGFGWFGWLVVFG